MESGQIRTVAIHGDTKLDNFLFSATDGRVKALVDLDTIMPHSWLADWGDMVRSLSNLAGEKEADLSKVQVDTEIFEALARGFLNTARMVTEEEIELMVDAVQILALELGVRFLADFIRGDSYFKLGPTDLPNLNKRRAMVQLTLFERLLEQSGHLQQVVRKHWRERNR
jgi:N-acetylhexosamine 1-kinase